jgi:hypothetical protein
MKRTDGVALLWTKWLGGAAVVLAALAVLLLRQRSSLNAEEAGKAPESRVASGSPSESGEPGQRALSGQVPRFQVQASERSSEGHSQALRLKERASASGGRIPPAFELFDGEARDPGWAPAMEQAVNDRMQQAGAVLSNAGLKGARVKAAECRTSTCRLEFDYTDQDLTKAREAGALSRDQSPFGFLVQQTGPFARASSDLRPEPVEVVDGVTRFRQAVYLVFGEAESDPRGYAAWVSEARRQMEHRRSLGPMVKVKGLPPPELR